VGGGIDTVHQSEGRRWHRVASTLPRRCWCRAGLASGLVHGNALRALRALGCAAALIWRGQCDVNGQDRGQLLQGIGSRCRGGSGGEVTGRGVDGGLLAELGCPRWPWLLAGQRGVARAGL
jgi:hypothetical protein